MEHLTISDWHEEVNPDQIVISVNNGKQLTIRSKNCRSPKIYQLWLQMLDVYHTNPSAKQKVDTAISEMHDKKYN